MDLMSDSELELVIAANGVRKLEVVMAGEKEHFLVVTLTSGIQRGVRTARGGRRIWASIDSVVGRLKTYAALANVELPPISLVLSPPSDPYGT